MECPFQVGDEVVCIITDWGPDASRLPDGVVPPVKGEQYTVTGVYVTARWGAYIRLSSFGKIGFDPDYFRKVERRNDSLSIEAFLTIKPGQFEEPKRKAPAKKRERVQ